MAHIEVFEKKPIEIQDYDIGFGTWLSKLPSADTALSVVGTADSGITLMSTTLSGSTVKIWVSGGTTNKDYVVYLVLTTTGGRVVKDTVLFQIRG